MTREPGDLPAATTLTAPSGGGRKGDQNDDFIDQTYRRAAPSPNLACSRAIPIFAAALLGIFIIGGVGFSHIEAVHNAATTIAIRWPFLATREGAIMDYFRNIVVRCRSRRRHRRPRHDRSRSSFTTVPLILKAEVFEQAARR